MKPLHVCVVMSNSYFPIYQKIFDRALPKEFDSVNILHVRDHNSSPGAVGEKSFKHINYKKLEFVAKQLIAHHGDNLLVLDVDIVCFRNIKDEINSLLEDNDMVLQRNPPNPKNSPYGIGVWGLQCSTKNISFFGREILPRSQALLITQEEWEEIHEKQIPIPVPLMYLLNGEMDYYDGDQCVLNEALLNSEIGQDIDVSFLPDTYALYGIEPENPKDIALYHAISGGRTVEDKSQTLIDVYEKIMNKTEHNK